MSSVKISIILCVYNEEAYIEKAIKSVLNQNFKDFELIIVNDGSKDNTLNIINSFKDERIKIYNQENKGLSASRNIGIKVANGEYLMFLDGDDFLIENSLNKAYLEASSKNTDISFFKIINYFDKYYESDWFSLKTFSEDFKDKVFNSKDTSDFLFDLSVSACQKIYNMDFLLRINANFPEGIHFEDMPFFFYVYLKAERISILSEFLYVRRKHDGSITDKVDGKFLDTVEAGRILFNIFIENDWYEDYAYDLIAYKINGPRYALMEIEDKYKDELFKLIHEDYLEIKQTKYYSDFLKYLGPVKKKFFLDVLSSSTYLEFSEL